MPYTTLFRSECGVCMGRCPALAWHEGQLKVLDAPSEPIGIHQNTKPVIVELSLQPEMAVLLFTDGLQHAGERAGQPLDLLATAEEVLRRGWSAQEMADVLLGRALVADHYRPGDDISVLVLAVLPTDVPHEVRRFSVSFPV